jgi:hypothetical protein
VLCREELDGSAQGAFWALRVTWPKVAKGAGRHPESTGVSTPAYASPPRGSGGRQARRQASTQVTTPIEGCRQMHVGDSGQARTTGLYCLS